MTIILNGESTDVAPNTSITQLLEICGIKQKKGLAIACNDDVIHRDAWTTTQLHDGDCVEILQATAGG